MTVFIQLTIAGADTGPFDLYSNSTGSFVVFATGVAKSDLITGGWYTIPDGTTIIRIISTDGICNNSIDISVQLTITSTSTSSTSSTSTTITTITTQCPGPYQFYDVNSYICDGETCASTQAYARIANCPIDEDLTIGNFYLDNSGNTTPPAIFEVVGVSADQSSPAYITEFTGTGHETCNEICMA